MTNRNSDYELFHNCNKDYEYFHNDYDEDYDDYALPGEPERCNTDVASLDE